LVTVAPPLSRLHLSALCVTALLCVCFAWPAVAKPPEGKGPSAHALKAGKHAGNSGRARGQAKAKPTPPGQLKNAAKAVKQAPPGQAKKSGGSAKTASPGQLKKSAVGAKQAPPGQLRKHAATVAPSGASAAQAQNARAPSRKRRALARARAAAARDSLRAEVPPRARRPARTAPTPADPARTARVSHARADRAEPREGLRGTRFEPVVGDDQLPQPLRVVRDVVKVVPTPLRILVAGLVALLVLLTIASGLTLLRNRRLAAQRRHLLGEVGMLQGALLPAVPAGLSACRVSVAYRPADGPAAGGDFYDIVSLAGGRTALLIGDVSGHGRAALGRTALARYTLRAYLEAGLEPREALQIAGSVLVGKLAGDFVTALVAIHDAGTGTLTYATAGHPPPIVVSGAPFEPILVGTAPPLGLGASTGQRQTTLPFPPGALACFYTDGLSEARTAEGQLGVEPLERIIRELGPDVTAQQVIDEVASSARTITDDAAACVIAAEGGAGILRSRLELLEVTRDELRGPVLRGFLDACGVAPQRIRTAEREANDLARRSGTAIVEVRLGDRPRVDVRPRGAAAGDGAMAYLRQPSAPGR